MSSRSHRRAAVALAAATAALAVPAVASAATLTVDNDRQECKKAQFTSINAAIAAAAPGDTVRVCAGLYPERVNVGKPLELVGPRQGNGAAPSRDDAPDPRRDAIVANATDAGFDVQASNVRIAGFTVQGTQANPYPGAGIYLREGANREIEGNVLAGNRNNVYGEGSQTALEIERNGIYGAAGPDLGQPVPPPVGGVFLAGSASQRANDVTIEHNAFARNGQYGVNVGTASDRGFSISHNTSDQDGTFVVIGRTTGARVEHNKVEESRSSGIFPYGDNVDLSIAYNDLDGSNVSNFGIAPRAAQFGTTGGNPGLNIAHNRITQFFDGISLDGVDGATIAFNQTRGNDRHGIRLFNAVNSLVAHNDSRDNARDGIRVDTASRENQIEHNVAYGNGEHDCHDDSVGERTAGTANTWEDDRGRTENRPGLCEGAETP
ncbi:MAG TPA: right-handed parallel beta-helix repeat-containing protein [Solirubrobacteraceae bacterium]|jgi:nitrous oxidase accessory protein NosD